MTRIRSAADCAAALTGQILAYSGKAGPVFEAVDVSQLARGMLDLLRAAVSEPTRIAAVTRFTAPFGKLRDALNRDARSRIGSRLDAIEVVKRDQSGRAASFALRGAQQQVLRGEDLRARHPLEGFVQHAHRARVAVMERLTEQFVALR